MTPPIIQYPFEEDPRFLEIDDCIDTYDESIIEDAPDKCHLGICLVPLKCMVFRAPHDRQIQPVLRELPSPGGGERRIATISLSNVQVNLYSTLA